MGTLTPDPWLAAQLQRPCYRQEPGTDSAEAISAGLLSIPGGEAFAWSKISCEDMSRGAALQAAGFRVVDVNLGFVKPLGSIAAGPSAIRDAIVDDEEAVADIAGSSYRFSRFHLDPRFARNEANALKREWVRNYFRGQRGERLFVAERNGRIAGFLLALRSDRGCVIDLIAVAEHAQRQGIGAELIGGCERAYAGTAEISAGTQAANLPSVRLYERLGFRLRSSHYLLHWHK